MNYLFTSESVSEGHPDKVCDQISDAILDEHLKQDKYSRVACESLIAKNLLVIAGEITGNGKVDYEETAKRVLRRIGYDNTEVGFDLNDFKFIKSISGQASDIALGVDREGAIGAGDQGLMFGYAVNETSEMMPLPISLAHRLLQRLAELRKAKKVSWLLPDSKSQVTVSYKNGKPESVEKIVLSTQHREEVSQIEIKEFVIEEVIRKIIPVELRSSKTEFLINPTGRFVEGGPYADTGLTGRKIIVDTYGGSCPHGGGAFSGKDSTKVDRSAAYMARYIAKNIVASGIAERCTIQISYAIGVIEPVSFYLNFHGTGKVNEEDIQTLILKEFDLSPGGIIRTLNLREPVFGSTASYGHFGRPEFSWEKTDKINIFK